MNCKPQHNKNHIIIKYEDKNCLCDKHYKEKFLHYCNTCKKDICIICKSRTNKSTINKTRTISMY